MPASVLSVVRVQESIAENFPELSGRIVLVSPLISNLFLLAITSGFKGI